MNKLITLKADIRDIVGKKVAKFRKENKVPAVVYGNKIACQNLWINDLDFARVYSKAGESALIELEIKGEKHSVLIHDLQNDHRSGKVSHVDFFQVNMKEEVETEIPLEFVGEAAAVKALGGVLIKNMDAVSVKCLPANLPEKFVIDLTKLATFEDHITIADLKISDSVEILLEDDTVIAIVAAPRTEAEMDGLNQKVEEDVTKVAGVVKEVASVEEKK
ncbi:MAG: 50S ribosomal protein L25 [Candidatus Moranbacteria bacterium]|nr:50S ribosomal protein L25 [Candidatus Moranbacteria bacterium]